MPHSHHEHPHTPPKPEDISPISRLWQRVTVFGNLAIGAGEIATGGLSTLAVLSDGVHNVSDAATYHIQAENVLNPHLSDERRDRRRKIAHWLIAATSLGVATKAGVDLALDHETAPNALSIYTAGASLTLNSFVLMSLRSGMRRMKALHGDVATDHEHDLSKHLWAVDIPSAGLAVFGALIQKFNVDIEQVAAIASGLIGVWAFRPTKANLDHSH